MPDYFSHPSAMAIDPLNPTGFEADFVHLAKSIWEGRKSIGKIILISIATAFAASIHIPKPVHRDL